MERAAAGGAIRVNTVQPGLIDTPIWTKLPASSESNAHDGCSARLRRWYDGQRETAQELRLAASESARKDPRVCGNLP